jgi:hypothetical protein
MIQCEEKATNSARLRSRAAKKPGLYGNGHGLYLQVSAFDTKAWVFRYMIDGRSRKMGVGPLHTVSLAEARKRTADARLRALSAVAAGWWTHLKLIFEVFAAALPNRLSAGVPARDGRSGAIRTEAGKAGA